MTWRATLRRAMCRRWKKRKSRLARIWIFFRFVRDQQLFPDALRRIARSIPLTLRIPIVDGRTSVRATVAKEVGVGNPAEETTAARTNSLCSILELHVCVHVDQLAVSQGDSAKTDWCRLVDALDFCIGMTKLKAGSGSGASGALALWS